jgi:CubicO group peptidase (beta-lactamase class C family)
MMARRWWKNCVMVLMLVAPAAIAQPVDTRAIDAVMRDALKAWQVPGAALAIVRGNEVIYLKGFGVKELGGDEPVTPDTLFPIASCTKAFTTTAMAILVDEHKMAWDDPVRKHVSYFHLADPLADAEVTLRDLVTHRTGLSGHDLLWYRAPWSCEEIIRRIGRVPLKHSFRSTFQYQSIMFTTAGAAVEAASGQKWEKFVQKRLFEPLGMTGAVFTTGEADKTPDRASPHRRNAQGGVEVIPFYPLRHPDPAGSIHAGARDLSRWVRLHLGRGMFNGKQLVSAQNLGETQTAQMVIRLEGQARDMNPETHVLNYGMGWVLQDYRGRFVVSHAGAIDGFRVHITLIPDSQLGLVLLNNLHQSQMNLAVSNRLVDLLLGLAARDWNQYLGGQVKKAEAAALARQREREAKRRPVKPSRDLAAYAGTYEDPAYGTATVALVNGSLIWNWSTFTSSLEHFEGDTFIVANDLIGRPLLTFTLGQDGAVATMRFQEALETEFKKVRSDGKR